MTPVRAQLESIVDGQRRKQLLVTIVAALIETVLFAALLFALFRVGMPNLVLSKPRRAALVLLVVLAFATAFLVEQRRHARSVLFWAKRIDDANKLDDHFVSALAFPDPVHSGFEQACINALVTRLSTVQLRLPDVRLERLWLIGPAVVVALATGLVEYQRRKRPEDDGRAMVLLSTDRGPRWDHSLDDDSPTAKADAKLRADAREVRTMFADLAGKSLSKETILSRVSAESQRIDAFERDNPSIIQTALQLGDPSTQRARSFLNGVQSGQAQAVDSALDAIEKALSGQIPPPLSPEERAELKGVLDELAKATNNASLAKQLQQAAETIADPSRNPDAVQAVRQLRAPLEQQLTGEKATQQLAAAVRSLLAQTRREANLQTKNVAIAANGAHEGGGERSDAGGPTIARAGGDQIDRSASPDDEQVGKDPDQRMGDKSAGSASAPNYKGGTGENPTTNSDERVGSPWVGAPVRQLVAAASASDKGAQDAYREQLKATLRIAENEVQREQIPAEYAGAIRTYFFNLQQDWDRQWKPSK